MTVYAISAASIRSKITSELTKHQRECAGRMIERYNRELIQHHSVDTMVHVSEPVAYEVAGAFERHGWKVSLRHAKGTRSVYHLQISLI